MLMGIGLISLLSITSPFTTIGVVSRGEDGLRLDDCGEGIGEEIGEITGDEIGEVSLEIIGDIEASDRGDEDNSPLDCLKELSLVCGGMLFLEGMLF